MEQMPPVAKWDPAVEQAYDAVIEAADHNLSVDGGDWDSRRDGEDLLRWANPENSHFALSATQCQELVESLNVFLNEEHQRVRGRRNAGQDEH
jgi:hypothetical protein